MILASRSSRLVAEVIDAMMCFTPFMALEALQSLGYEPIPVAAGGVWASALVFCIGYFLFADALPGGQSFGKALFGIAAIDQRNGIPCSAWQSFVRNVLLFACGLVDWIVIFGERRQRLGDMAAQTIVVEVASMQVHRYSR
jgi:uncharacterized RDD family membrane protein YckC